MSGIASRIQQLKEELSYAEDELANPLYKQYAWEIGCNICDIEDRIKYLEGLEAQGHTEVSDERE